MASNAGISNANLLDLTQTTLANLPNLTFEVALDYQNYPVCNQWFRGDKVQIHSGTSIERNIILDTSGNARHVRLYQKTPINVSDVHFKVTAPWVQIQTYWSIERRELLRNRKPAMFIDLLKSRRLDATLDMANLLELRAWSTPASASDDLNPRGLPYWLSHREDDVTSATDNGGFSCFTVRYVGGGTSGSKGGITTTSSVNTKWANWGAVYTAVNGDFVKRMRRAFHATSFVAPLLARDLRQGAASKFRIYMNLDVLTEYEDLVTSSNENLGKDLDPFHGLTTFKRVPIIYTPQLDNYTTGPNATATDPVFAVNHNHFFPIVQDGDWMREEDPMSDVEQHNTVTSFVDGSYNYFCNNVRQAGFVLHKTIPA